MAGKAERRLAEALAARDAARAKLLGHAERLKSDYTPGKIAKRLADDLSYRARDAAMQAMDIAGDNRGWLASALSLAGLVLARKPAQSAGMALWQGLLSRKSAKAAPETAED